jgi:CheY-like chemotaxis protein
VNSSESNYILIVDDLVDNLALTRFALESAGYSVMIETTGEEAIARVKHAPPHLILLDVRMPGMDGIEVTQRLRQDSTLPPIPILLVTADRDVLESQALEIGANGILYKPLNYEELLLRVEPWFSP